MFERKQVRHKFLRLFISLLVIAIRHQHLALGFIPGTTTLIPPFTYRQSIGIDAGEDPCGVCCLYAGNKQEDDLSAISYKSKSTAAPEAASEFYQGSEERRERLDRTLQEIGVSIADMDSAEFRGSAALRTYNSFILPKSKGALAMANQPQRAAVVANNISFLMREHRSHQQEWLRNHDRSVKEAAELKNSQQSSTPEITIVLDDIRSAHNVGNIFRAAEASSCQQILCCGSMTPAPPHPKVLKTALGAAQYVPHQSSISTLESIKILKADNYKIFGIETTSKSLSLWQVSFFPAKESNVSLSNDSSKEFDNKIALIFGNELVGVDIQVLEECDVLVKVPTHGIKNSLNVATCASIIIWEALRQWECLQQNEDTH